LHTDIIRVNSTDIVNVVADWVAFLDGIPEVSGSDLGSETAYLD
jgi:hypothetical protein